MMNPEQMMMLMVMMETTGQRDLIPEVLMSAADGVPGVARGAMVMERVRLEKGRYTRLEGEVLKAIREGVLIIDGQKSNQLEEYPALEELAKRLEEEAVAARKAALVSGGDAIPTVKGGKTGAKA